MFTLLRLLPLKRVALEQVPTLLAAWLVAELFYKFHSFTLECAAFLLTWFVFDAIVQGGKALIFGTPITAKPDP
jgi:hypothetical protein